MPNYNIKNLKGKIILLENCSMTHQISIFIKISIFFNSNYILALVMDCYFIFKD